MQRKTKIIAAIIIMCTIAVSTVALVWAYYASYTRSFSWTVANTQFELDVNGTQQTVQNAATIDLGAVSSSDSYCEVYTLTNKGNTPINITASISSTGIETFTWLTATGSTDMVTLGAGQSSDMVLLINDFTTDGTATISFNSVKAFISDPTLVFSLTEVTKNDADYGNMAPYYWALDNYNKTVQVWNLGGNNYVGLVAYNGTFTTFGGSGAVSPQKGVAETSAVTGTMIENYVVSFTATGLISTPAAVYNEDLQGTTTGNKASWSWSGTFMAGLGSLYYSQWDSTYSYKGQMWNEYVITGGSLSGTPPPAMDRGSNGDIVA